MLSDHTENIGSGNITTGIESDASIKSVAEFIESNFGEFAQKVKGEPSKSEKAITDQLCKYLNRKANGCPFYFHHENMEDSSSGNSPTTDIGTLSRSEQLIVGDKSYGEFDSFFSIEAKRLPTPGQNREKEYVIGHDRACGGIERFKKGIHGKELKVAAIIGYIQEDNFDTWFLKINGWIDELITSSSSFWNSTDKLVNSTGIEYEFVKKLESDHVRIIDTVENENIKLLHFWINLV